MSGTVGRRLRALLPCLAGAVAAALLVTADGIPQAPGGWLADEYAGAPATAVPVPGTPPERNPHLAPAGRSGMHGDTASSDTHPFPGPLGRDPAVVSRRMAPVGGECATVAFDTGGRLVTVCGTIAGFRLKLLEPRTLRVLAEHELPQRPSTIEAITRLSPERVFRDTSGGAYFYLDAADRVVLADSRQHVLRIAHRQDAAGEWRFDVEADHDLSRHVPHDCVSWTHLRPDGECDAITSVMPDWDGRVWWVTRHGRIGTLDPRSGSVRAVRLAGEEIQNSFSVARDGVSIVSDHALYAFAAAADGTPRRLWREAYDRGTAVKPGSVNQGSGTTPTLLGDTRERYVAITDNADGRMNVLVYRRDAVLAPGVRRLVCTVPVFDARRSTTDNSLVGYGRTLVVENNYGYENVTSLTFGRTVPGGLTRVDVRPDGTGCDVVWTSPVRSPSTVAKLSTVNGLVYVHVKRPNRWGLDTWYLTAVDLRDGRERWRRLTGTGPSYDNAWAPITLGPDGTAYVGVFNGLVAVRDT
jgi:hypothetical protein